MAWNYPYKPAADREAHGGSPKKPYPWNMIIYHHTDTGGRALTKQTAEFNRQFFKNISDWLTRKDTNYLSAHFHIGRHGEVEMLVDPDYYIAYHAGQSSWFHSVLRRQVTDLNRYAIGIELLGDGNIDGFTDAQYKALGKLTREIMERYPKIQARNITGHENVAPGRKKDPGQFFDWNRAFREIFGANRLG